AALCVRRRRRLLNSCFGDFGSVCATPSGVCSTLNPVVASVGFRARGRQQVADSRGSLCSPKAVLEESGSCREGQLTGLLANSSNRPEPVIGRRAELSPERPLQATPRASQQCMQTAVHATV